jgi:fido (protein-threonine AMPylation protein)
MAKLKKQINDLIIRSIKENPGQSSKEIFDGLGVDIGYATLKRALQGLVNDRLINTTGQGKGTRYVLSESFELLYDIDVDDYFKKEIDERTIRKNFNHLLITKTLKKNPLFTDDELNFLDELQQEYTTNISKLSETERNKEMERLAIDLSWKSSQIEGNTYSLLETEKLLKDQETAAGKTRDEATMLINHKAALDFIFQNPDYIDPLQLSRIEDIHSILIRHLNVDRNIRKGRVGISGTNYRPLDIESQIKESMEHMCELINTEKNVFAKALLALVLISYIQPFNDGNKRTARIISNALLIHHHYCPISFRTVDSIEYKKAMLIFYEQNNISAFKRLFISQFEFAVKTYF